NRADRLPEDRASQSRGMHGSEGFELQEVLRKGEESDVSVLIIHALEAGESRRESTSASSARIETKLRAASESRCSGRRWGTAGTEAADVLPKTSCHEYRAWSRRSIRRRDDR